MLIVNFWIKRSVHDIFKKKITVPWRRGGGPYKFIYVFNPPPKFLKSFRNFSGPLSHFIFFSIAMLFPSPLHNLIFFPTAMILPSPLHNLIFFPTAMISPSPLHNLIFIPTAMEFPSPIHNLIFFPYRFRKLPPGRGDLEHYTPLS